MPNQYLYCERCGVGWVRVARRGRPPMYCNTCRYYSQPAVRRRNQPIDANKIQLTDGGRSDEGINDTNDCTVRAIAIACSVSYAVAHAWFARNGRKARKGINFSMIMSRNGYEVLGHKLVPTAIWRSRGLKTLLQRNPQMRTGTWILAQPRHVVALKDGVMLDQFDSSRKETRLAYRVLPS